MGPALLPTPLSPARGLVFRRTCRQALGARCFPVFSRRNSRFCHRRSRRHPVSPAVWLVRRPCPRLARPRAWRSLVTCHLEQYSRPPKLSRIPSMSGRIARLVVERLSRLSQTARLPPAEAFAMRSSNSARIISATSSGSKKSFVFKSFDHQSKSFSFPSDVLRLRCRSESRKLCKADLSTFPRFSRGQEWVTQRFVATHTDAVINPASYRVWRAA